MQSRAPAWRRRSGVPYDVTFVKVDGTGVLVDPVGLKRSAWNLMDNARRAVAHGGSVEVRVRRHHHDAVLEVADSGPGFGGLPTQQGMAWSASGGSPSASAETSASAHRPSGAHW